MAIPILPIIMAVSALGSGIAQGISSVKNAKSEAKSAKAQAEDQINNRAKEAKKLMQQQKTSFLKSGVYFDSGSPLEVINETYDTMKEDINAIADDANQSIKNLTRQGKTAFYSSLIQGMGNAAMSYFGAGGTSNLLSGGVTSAKNNFASWWQNLSGNYKGGFGQLPANSGYMSSGGTILS